MAQHWILQGDAVGAQDGPAFPGDGQRLPYVVELAQADLLRLQSMIIFQPSEVQRQEEPLLQLQGHVGQLRLGQLEGGKRAVENLA